MDTQGFETSHSRLVVCEVSVGGGAGAGGVRAQATDLDQSSAKKSASHQMMMMICPEYAQRQSKQATEALKQGLLGN